MPNSPYYSSSQVDTASEPTTMPPPRPASSAATRPLTLIVATTPITSDSNPAVRRFGIGHDGNLPWPRIKTDMGFFARVTTRPPPPPSPSHQPPTINAVVMGRKTYDSIPERFRPLRKRLNVIISRDQSGEVQRRVVGDWRAARRREKEKEKERAGVAKLDPEIQQGEREHASVQTQIDEEDIEKEEPEILVSSSLDSALGSLRSEFPSRFPAKRLGNVFVIGGAEIYASALRLDLQSAPGYFIRLLMTDVRRLQRQQEEEQSGSNSTGTTTNTPTAPPGYDPSEAVDGFECSTFFPLSLDDIEGTREWRKADSSEVTGWVGEEVSGKWKWEGDIALRMCGYERIDDAEEN